MVVQRSIHLASILFAALILPLPGGVCVAGEDEEPKAAAATRGFTFRPHPLPYSRSFAVFDLGLSYRLNKSKGYYSTDSRVGVSLDLGYMRNLSPENAVGVSVFGLSDERSGRGGVRARYRRWLTPVVGARRGSSGGPPGGYARGGADRLFWWRWVSLGLANRGSSGIGSGCGRDDSTYRRPGCLYRHV